MEYYDNVRTWRDLLDINIKFLNGEISETYYHVGPTDPETVPLLTNLRTINDLGFYSTSGQPGLIDHKFTIPEYNDEGQPNPYYKPGLYGDSEQKSYIEGFMLDDEVSDKFEIYLKKHPKFVYTCSIQSTKEFRSTLPPGKMYNVTRERDYFDKPEDNWEHYTNLQNNYLDEYSDLENVDELLRKTKYFNIASTEYGPQLSVENLLLNFYKNDVLKVPIIYNKSYDNYKILSYALNDVDKIIDGIPVWFYVLKYSNDTNLIHWVLSQVKYSTYKPPELLDLARSKNDPSLLNRIQKYLI